MKLLPHLFKVKPIEFQKYFIFFVFWLIVISLFLSAKIVRAQIPRPVPVPCNQTNEDVGNDDEFHTLRPYQASPCNQDIEDTALFCGNDLFLTDNITVRKNDARYCNQYSSTRYECFFVIPRNYSLAIDVTGTDLPIMGRTEDDVVNSRIQPDPEGTDDAEKVNEYVSWYLNGVYPPAEYGKLDTNDAENTAKLVDFSGPINKLLPERIKRDEIWATIQNLGGIAPDNQHDQVIGCVNSINQITPCYPNPQRLGVREVRLSDLSEPPWEEGYPNYEAFRRAYMRWRGYACPNIPIINIAICIKNPLSTYRADLFYKISPSSHEDRVGAVEVVNPYVQPASPGVTITDVSIVTTPAELFFSHMEESRKLADTLQNTFVPKGNPKSGSVSQVSPAPYCDLTEIRTNPGDDLFPGEIRVDPLTYTANFSCGFEIEQPPPTPYSAACDAGGGICVPSSYSCDRTRGQLGCRAGFRCKSGCDFPEQNPSCSVQARVVLNTVTETPLVDEIWSRLVAGSSAVFKRIFPKIESGAPVEGILDIPAATGVSYALRNAPGYVSLTAGNPNNQRGGAAELYFPHIGGIQQYFLQCIQTALRPQGFGEVCPSGLPPEQSSGTCPSVPDSAIDSRWLAGKQNFIRIAGQRIGGCPDTLAEECYNYVVKEAQGAGVNPAFALTIWFNESAASNYCRPNTADFGIRNGAPSENIIEQLEMFLVQPFRITASCRNNPAWTEPMEAFLSVFHGNYPCDPSYNDGGYYGDVLDSWHLVTEPWGVCGGALFGINWPTDNSCP